MKVTPRILVMTTTVILLAACREGEAPPSVEPASHPVAPAAEVVPGAGQATLTPDKLLEHIGVLASDEFGGRAPMSEGERLTLEYLENGFRELGLEPMFDGSYRQAVALVAIETGRDTALTLSAPDGTTRTFAWGPEVIYSSALEVEETGLDGSELVWAGYGIVAPEYDWNDYAGLDVTGKTVVVLVNDPGYASADPALFNGRRMTYYGRWTYKFEEAARQGAAGVLIVHQDGPAGYGWNVVEDGRYGPQFYLAEGDEGSPRLQLRGWVQHEVAREILAMAGHDFDRLEAEAARGPVAPQALGLMADAPIRNTISHAESYNVGAVLRGAERPEELFLYMAHWDHLGTAEHEPGAEGDFIFNGAEDNASGTAGLLMLAETFATQEHPPARSVGFLAVTAEESGLLGSKAYAADPAWPLNQTVGGINMDRLNFRGRMSDVVVIGHGSSEMEEVLAEAAARYGRSVTAEATPEKGFFYRSDHFNFAKRGVPVLYARGGTTDREHGADYVTRRNAEYVADRYHTPADEIRDDWDVDAAIEDLNLFFDIGWHLVNSEQWPHWYGGNEFRAIREASLAERRD